MKMFSELVRGITSNASTGIAGLRQQCFMAHGVLIAEARPGGQSKSWLKLQKAVVVGLFRLSIEGRKVNTSLSAAWATNLQMDIAILLTVASGAQPATSPTSQRKFPAYAWKTFSTQSFRRSDPNGCATPEAAKWNWMAIVKNFP